MPLPAQDGDSLCTLKGVRLGLTEPNLLSVGYAFLSQFTTIWDPQAHRKYLCTPQ